MAEEYAHSPVDAYGEHVAGLSDSNAFANVAQGLTGQHREVMLQYWQDTINSIEHEDHKFKIHQLPLARIKKVMKADEDVKMISAEAPILFAKGCDVFITELTMRAWIHAEENKRRTLQRSDIAAALQKSDMFDFLIDIVPREEALGSRRPTTSMPSQYGETEGPLPEGQDELQDIHQRQHPGHAAAQAPASPSVGAGPSAPPAASAGHFVPGTIPPGHLAGPVAPELGLPQPAAEAAYPPGQAPPHGAEFGHVYPPGYGDNIDYNGYRQY